MCPVGPLLVAASVTFLASGHGDQIGWSWSATTRPVTGSNRCTIVLDSSRHIVSTTISTCGGFLALNPDDGYFRPTFAMAIAGGRLLSTVTSFC